jgi:deoxyribodipyrimidine photo-lyase
LTDRPCIVWFRDDLRLSDHPALSAAVASGAPVVALYVFDEISPGPRKLGAASRWWLAQSLKALGSELKAKGCELVLRRGEAARIIPALAREAGAAAVYWNKIAIEPYAAIANAVGDALAADGVECFRFTGDLLANPQTVRTKDGNGLRVFTPFWRRVQALGDPPAPLPAPGAIRPGPTVASDSLGDWNLEPRHPDWAGGLRDSWTPGEAGALAALDAFLERGAPGYTTNRDRMDRPGTSRLSPHLRFGEIGPRQVWHAAKFAAARDPAIAAHLDKFLSEVGWREFCRHLLYDRPDLHRTNLQSSFDEFPWQDDQKALRAWQRGCTGYPIVDAGMRELWHTGVMHNRVRMVVASFLVKHLLIDWRCGEEWFWDTLVDADPGSNPANWQWVAGCGADAAPYFRIFNPVLQGEKFDPDGAYVRRWVPELAKLPANVIHQPWSANAPTLTDAGIVLGQTYPKPIVDHRAARDRALNAYATTRNG